MMRAAVALALALLIAAVAGGQTVIPRSGETIDVSIVNVDVVVTDKQGHRVRGLTRDDFIVLENGVRQPITNFAEYRNDVQQSGVAGVEVPDTPAATAKPVAARNRTFVLFFDRLPLKPWDSEMFFGGLRQLMHRVVRPGDAVMIVTWARYEPLLRLPFTDDVATIDATLAQLQSEALHIVPATDAISKEERDYDRAAAIVAASRGYSTNFSESAPTLSSLGDATLVRGELTAKMRSIRSFIESISGDESKKVMMLVTHRFSREAGLDLLLPRRAELGPRLPDPRFDMSREIDSLIRTANANDVTLYTLYPEGITGDAVFGADVQIGALEVSSTPGVGARSEIVLGNELEALRRAAEQTGGTMEWATKSIAEMLPSIEDDLNAYYSLAYRVPASRTPRARKITVKTKDTSLLVRSRKEFVEKSDDDRIRARVISNLLRETGQGSIPITLEQRELVRDGKKYRGTFRVRIPVSSLMTAQEHGVRAGSFSVFIGWSGVFGEIGEGAKKTQKFQLRPNETAPAGAVFTYDFDVLIDQKTETIAVAVYDDLSREFGVARLVLPPRPASTAAGAP